MVGGDLVLIADNTAGELYWEGVVYVGVVSGPDRYFWHCVVHRRVVGQRSRFDHVGKYKVDSEDSSVFRQDLALGCNLEGFFF